MTREELDKKIEEARNHSEVLSQSEIDEYFSTTYINPLKRFFMKPTQQKLEHLFRKLQLQNMKVILGLQWASVSLVKWVYLLCLK